MKAKEFVTEKWGEKYKRSINCTNPKGFSQRAHCAGRKKNEAIVEALLVTDVPNEDWLEGKREYAKSRGRDSFGVPYLGSTTAYVRQPSYVELPVDLLARIPGARGEQSNVRYDDLKAIMKIMQDTGKLPLDSNGKEYMPFITVAWNGEPWVSEGNHRIMAAKRLGWKTLPVELKYFDGGERIRSGILYPGKIGLGDVKNSHETDENPLVVVYDKDGELHTHANLSVANNIFRTNVKPDDVFKGPVKVKSGGSYGEVTFALSKHHKSGVAENFADGKKPGRKGLAKRVGVDCKQPVNKLRSIAAHSSGEKQRMAHWCANMKSGRSK